MLFCPFFLLLLLLFNNAVYSTLLNARFKAAVTGNTGRFFGIPFLPAKWKIYGYNCSVVLNGGPVWKGDPEQPNRPVKDKEGKKIPAVPVVETGRAKQEK